LIGRRCGSDAVHLRQSARLVLQHFGRQLRKRYGHITKRYKTLQNAYVTKVKCYGRSKRNTLSIPIKMGSMNAWIAYQIKTGIANQARDTRCKSEGMDCGHDFRLVEGGSKFICTIEAASGRE
jgi:hypothetical protein